jgi:CBS domain-containing protein
MTTVQQVLDTKGHSVWTIHANERVHTAIQKMVDKEVGSLIVIESDTTPVGIITERHYIRMVVQQSKFAPEMPVRDVMQPRFFYVRPEHSLEECMAIMTEKRVRHLPVLSEGRLDGIISIGDLVKGIIADQKFVIEELISYIGGEAELRHPGEISRTQ